MIEIVPIICEDYPCSAANIATIANYYKRDYYMVFTYSLFFNTSQRKKWDECLIRESSEETDTLMEKYHGIRICSHITKDKKQLISEINKGPLILYNDVFDCIWTPLYQKKHLKHSVVVIGIDKEQLVCLDPFFVDSIVKIKMTELKSIIHYETFQVLDDYQRELDLEPIRWSAISYKKVLVKNDFCMRELIERFFSELNLNKVLSTNEIQGLSLLRLLKNIDRNRGNYIYLLRSLSEKFEIDFNDCISMLEVQKKRWTSFWMYLLKMILKKLRPDFDILSKSFSELMYHEEVIIDELLLKVNQYNN